MSPEDYALGAVNRLTANEIRSLEGLPPQARTTYRFHGQQPPKRVVNELPSGPVVDGVATLRLYDPIDSWGGEWGVSAKEFVSSLDKLTDVSEIRLHINSPGGEVFEGIAILNALRNHPARVVAVVDGIAASAASFIAAGADELIMGRNSELMIHDARGVCIGNAGDMAEMKQLLDHLSDNIASVYTQKAGGEVAGWREAMLAETWFSAEEAVDAGLADRVEEQPQPTNSFDLSNFKHAGRSQAPAPSVTATVGEKPELVVPPATLDEPQATGAATPTVVLRHRMKAKRLGLSA